MRRLTVVPLLVLAACAPRLPFSVEISTPGHGDLTLLANGYDEAQILITGTQRVPNMKFAGDSHSARLSAVTREGNAWRATLTASVNPGPVALLIEASGEKELKRSLTLLPQTSDSGNDGTPDFLRLEDENDRAAFLGWFTFLAEVQYFNAPAARPREISDCSALLRYAYREALRDHNEAWSSEAHLPLVPALSSIRKYSFPHTPLGANLFRTRGGTYSPSDLSSDVFRQFADVEMLSSFNTYLISRDIRRAKPGDLIFFRRKTKRVTYHSMVFLGASQVNRDNEIYVVYHTGPEGTEKAGEIRRLTLNQLLHFPDPQWQPIAANDSFLGIFRWNILKATS